MTERGNDLALCRADARVHRCEYCGMWCYGDKPCTTCAVESVRDEAG